jgi:hypothetical protein
VGETNVDHVALWYLYPYFHFCGEDLPGGYPDVWEETLAEGDDKVDKV